MESGVINKLVIAFHRIKENFQLHFNVRKNLKWYAQCIQYCIIYVINYAIIGLNPTRDILSSKSRTFSVKFSESIFMCLTYTQQGALSRWLCGTMNQNVQGCITGSQAMYTYSRRGHGNLSYVRAVRFFALNHQKLFTDSKPLNCLPASKTLVKLLKRKNTFRYPRNCESAFWCKLAKENDVLSSTTPSKTGGMHQC